MKESALMNTKQIDCILELAQTQNFNRAAENLFISQPTLTYQIKGAEEEIGFAIFSRSARGASLTPAGAQFVTTLQTIRQTLKAAIEQGQNFSAKYKDSIRMVLPIRSAIYFLPKAIRTFAEVHPEILIRPSFDWYHGKDGFLRQEQDILFAMTWEMRQIPDVATHPLFNSGIYLISAKDDRLAHKSPLLPEDLTGRTLMVGGGSPPALRSLQQELIDTYHLPYFNSQDHETTLTNVAAGRGICLAPGFLNDHNEEFAWTPLQTKTTIPCALYTHKNDHRPEVMEFVHLLQQIYRQHRDFTV